MKKVLKAIFLSSIIISFSYSQEQLVKPIKVTDIKDCSKSKEPCQECSFGSHPAAIIENGKELVGCYKCPKDTAPAMILKDGGLRCGKCPKGSILKEYKPISGILPSPGTLKYTCGCKDDNAYPVSQADGSIKCIKCPKGISMTGIDFIEDKKTGNNKFAYKATCA